MNNQEEKLWYLKNLDIFEGVSEEEMMKLAEKVQEISYNKDDLIYSENDPLDCIYMVKRGEVRLFHNTDSDKKNVFEVLGPGSIFGGIDFSNQKSSHTAQATHPTRVCIFGEHDFANIIAGKPQIMLRFIKKMTKKLQELEGRLLSRSLHAEDLILDELKNLQEKRENSLFGKFRLTKIHITHEELAELTGLNRVTVTRSLKKLKESGKIASEKSGIRIVEN